jgi:hypothetical protein
MIYSVTTAAAAPSSVIRNLVELNLCSGDVSKTMVVEMCRKLPHTNANRNEKNPSKPWVFASNHSPEIRPTGEASEKIAM